MVAARRRRATRPPNPPGAHALAEPAAARFVRDAGVGPHDLVLDLGAGAGAVTRPLARTGARVIAVERDERIGAGLRRRMAGHGNVTVVVGDALTVALPHRPFRVVANIPFSITVPLLRRLVDSRMTAADLVVESGAGRRLARMPDRLRAGNGTSQQRKELERWHGWFEVTLGARLPATAFRPAPSVDAVVLRLRRRRADPTGWRTPRSGRGRR